MSNHMEGVRFETQLDGSLRMVLRNPSASTDRDLFDLELAAAIERFRTGHRVVHWYHNGVKVSTQDDINPEGAWAAYTERHALMCN